MPRNIFSLLILLLSTFPGVNASQSVSDAHVVIVGPGVEITAEHVALELRTFAPGQQRQIVNDADMFHQMVNTLYRRARMAVEAEERGLDDDPLMRYRIERARRDLLVDAARNAFIETLEMPDFTELAHERYRANRDQHRVAERVHARHILLSVQEEDGKAERVAQADALMDRIRAGKDFEDLAREYSDDAGSSGSGGDLGFFERGRMVPAFEEAAFALREPGELAGPVETRFGIHIIQLVEYQDAHTRPFEEVREAIEARIRANYVRSELTAWTREVTDPAAATVDNDALEGLLDDARRRLNTD
ncbi:peptidylprolyl isomerase [Thioalkalivibrio thiocyanodenitrificans]|uniref:peptidylprolyl isomerase n=1 Tax=Thioalkalivibrio thiocyanodenitrificans TaxID=243063 RepID=UPI000363ADD3|nr:peptidylprolyl isomerase [Thioalkalivibrio thiocyanodenitrificans]